MGWYEDRFKPHPTRVQCICETCGRHFWMPRSHIKDICGGGCSRETVQRASNPWGLTAAQVEVMDALIQYGCRKLAADAMGIAVRTVDEHAGAVGRKMGARTGVQKILTWDRWRRAGAKEAN
jgi:DNA-binding NarL/FixJ family response regulator